MHFLCMLPRARLHISMRISGLDCKLSLLSCRAGGIAWGNDDLALLYESWWKTRRSVVHWFRPGHLEEGKHLWQDRNYEDAYNGELPLSVSVSHGAASLPCRGLPAAQERERCLLPCQAALTSADQCGPTAELLLHGASLKLACSFASLT